MKLVIRSQDTVINEMPLESGSWTVGRQPDNNIVIGDIKASRHHGVLTAENEQYFFEDLGSGNGTVIKGERIAANTRIEIKPGDAIVIGDASLTVEEGEVHIASTVDNDEATSTSMGLANLPDGQTGMLTAQAGPLTGKTFGLGDRPVFIGRVPACHIQIEDKLASRRNTEISREGALYRVRDMDSSNGTFLNNERIEQKPLRPGDVIRIGEHEFRFSFVAAADAPAVPEPQTVSTPSASPAEGQAAAASAAAPAPTSGKPGSAAMAGVAAVVAILIGAGIYFATRGDEAPGTPATPANGNTTPPVTNQQSFPVRVGRPTVMDVRVTLEKTGNVHPARQDVIPFQTGLKVEEVHVKNQQRVEKDAQLVTFELTEALRSARVQAQAAVNQAREEVAKAEAEVAKAEAAVKNANDNLKIAQDAFDRNKTLYDGGNLLQTEWDKIRTKLNDAKTALRLRTEEKKQAERSVNQAKEKVTQAQADFTDVQAKIDDLTVKAKSGGVVDGLTLKKGYTVTPETGTMSLIEYEKEVKVIASVSEDDIVLVREGMKAEVWLPRAPQQRFDGTVSLIPPTATDRNYDVEIKVANRDRHFRPGQQAVVRFVTGVHENAVTLPAAVLSAGKRGGYHVFTVDANTNKASLVPVRRGAETMHDGIKYVEVLPDPDAARTLQPDDVVVVDGHKSLQNGATVEIQNPDDAK